jgi:hypothetical protein
MIRVQVVYGRYTALDTVCARCTGSGKDPTATQSPCVYCGGSGVVIENLGRPYTYLAPDSTKLWDVLMCPVSGQGTKHATVVSLTSQYDGPCKEAYPLPTFPCKGNCGTVLTPEDPRYFCRVCWERVPAELRDALDAAAGFKALPAVRAIREYLETVA